MIKNEEDIHQSVTSAASLQKDIEDVSKIAIVPSILDVICRTTGMGFACVARVTEEKWIACIVKDDVAFGLKAGGELKLETTICHEIQQHHQAVVIDNVAEDGIYCNHHTPQMYGLQSYISVPIILKDGSFFGTLCAIDPKPATLNNPQIRGMFDCFVDLIATHLNNIREKSMAESALSEEKEIAKLREGFIAILGHDLRNPVTAIKGSAQMLSSLKVYNADLIKVIENSASRINDLTDTMLDLARGRLAGGFKTTLSDSNLNNILRNIIDELKSIFPNKKIDVDISINHPVNADNARIAQMFSNLLSNALKYGTGERSVKVKAHTTADTFQLSVSNAGKKIDVAEQQMLFKPFSRGINHNDKSGLGLGLYIADEIAHAHGGTITIDSADEETIFIFKMPL